MFESKLLPLHSAFLTFRYKIGIQVNKAPLVVEQNNYTTKAVNTYIVRDVDNCPKILLRNFTLKNCLFGATNIREDSDKSKYEYSGYGIAFDGKGEWDFVNDSARNVIIFGVGNNSSSHTDNRKNNFLVLGEGDIFGIKGSVGAPEKKFSIKFSKAKTKFCLSLHYN